MTYWQEQWCLLVNHNDFVQCNMFCGPSHIFKLREVNAFFKLEWTLVWHAVHFCLGLWIDDVIGSILMCNNLLSSIWCDFYAFLIGVNIGVACNIIIFNSGMRIPVQVLQVNASCGFSNASKCIWLNVLVVSKHVWFEQVLRALPAETMVDGLPRVSSSTKEAHKDQGNTLGTREFT